MRIFRLALGTLLATQTLLACPALHAQSASASFGVNILLNTFSEAVTADHRCTIHLGRADGPKEARLISCPATVDVQAIASASASRSGQTQRMNTRPDSAGNRLAVVAGKPMHSLEPVELTISW